MKILYITENINAVFQSQVVSILNKLAEKEEFKTIHLVIGLRNPDSVKKIEGLNPRIKLLTFKTFPMYPFFNMLTKKSLFNLFQKNNINHEYIIHTRIEFLGMLTTEAYYKLNSKLPNLLIDIRGAIIEEVMIYGRIHNILKYLKLFNYKYKINKILKNTKFINTVSNELKSYIIKKYDINQKTIFVIPTVAGPTFSYNKKKRKEIRTLLKIEENEILFVFSSGSEQAWQNDNEIVDILISKGHKILMLTKKIYDNPNIISKFVPYEEVNDYLNAADIGIIIRDNNIVNNVASPIKFSEYISSGLPVISNNSVNCINEIMKKNNCGIIKELKQLNNEDIDKLLFLNREKISQVGNSIFGISIIVDKYIKIYNCIEKERINNE